MKVSIIIAFLLIPVLAFSQQRNNNVHFGSMINPGYHQGSTGSFFGIQVINGVHFKTWYAGIGAGIDYYYFRSVPVFIDVRKDLLKRQAAPFVYLDFGSNIPWKKKEEDNPVFSTYKPGIYYDLGIGYKTPVSKKLFLTMSAGFSEKRMNERINNWWGPDAHQEIDYTLRKINVKIGLGF